jgi:AcrR family transcriptional regulator
MIAAMPKKTPPAASPSQTRPARAAAKSVVKGPRAPETSPRKRVSVRRVPQQARGQQTVQAVLRATGEEIERAGLDHLSTKRIAAAAGLSVGSLYGYFPNKESIIAALLDAWLTRVHDAIDEVHPRHGGTRDIFAYLSDQADSALAVYKDQPGLSALFGMVMSIPALHGMVDAHGQRVSESIASALAHYAPRASAADVRSTARTIPMICHQLLATAILDPRVDRPRMMTDMRVCLMALATRLLLPGAA